MNKIGLFAAAAAISFSVTPSVAGSPFASLEILDPQVQVMSDVELDSVVGAATLISLTLDGVVNPVELAIVPADVYESIDMGIGCSTTSSRCRLPAQTPGAQIGSGADQRIIAIEPYIAP
jgi:hypothetical protein